MQKTEEIFYKGENPNNYLKFEVGSTWSTNDTNLFRILSISNNKTKIVYHKSLSDWDYKDAFHNSYNTSGSKKKTLYDSIKHKNYLSLENYKIGHACNGREWSSGNASDFTCQIDVHHTQDDYISSITNNDLLQTLSNNSSWLKEKYIAYVTSENESYVQKSTRIGVLNISVTNAMAYPASAYEKSSNFLPLLTLKENVEIIKDEECITTIEAGSKECPYLLKCDDC